MENTMKRGFSSSDSLALQYRRQLVARDMAKVYAAFGHRAPGQSASSEKPQQQPAATSQESGAKT